MSGIKSTSGAPPPIDTGGRATSSQQQVAPVSPSSPSGGGTGSAVPQASSLSHLSEGSTLAAVVTARSGTSDTMLHTEIGNFRMTTGSSLPVGAHVILEVETVEDVILARIISLNGQKLASPPSATLLPTVSPDQAAGGALYGQKGVAPANILSEGLQNLTATQAKTSLQTASHPGGSKDGIPLPIPSTPDTQVPGKINAPLTDITFRGTGSAPAASAASGTTIYAQAHSPGLRQPPAAATSAPSEILGKVSVSGGNSPLSTPVIVRANFQGQVSNILPSLSGQPSSSAKGAQLSVLLQPQSGSPQVSLPTAAFQGQGIISSISGSGSGPSVYTVTVQAGSVGSFSYQTTSPPQVGSHVNVSISEDIQVFPLANAPATTGLFKTPHLPILSDWESLQTALNHLAAQDPALASQLLGSRIPAPNSQLGASLLFFLSALNGGSLDRWLGQDFRRSLETSGHRDLLGKLDEDFATFGRLTTDNGGQDWKLLSFPFLQDQYLKQLRLFFRQHQGGPDNPDEESTRFIIELDLSRTGPVQLDGLFRKAKFDLVFRSEKPVPDDMQNRVLTIFSENMEITGLKGQLVFQRISPFPVHPTEEWESTGPDSIET